MKSVRLSSPVFGDDVALPSPKTITESVSGGQRDGRAQQSRIAAEV
jgi:hypothetical protein